MKGKLLTIIVPVYNTEQYLRKCLDSLIVPEGLESLEVIIVIDGSPDNSLEIAQEYSKKYPSVFKVINKKNGGHGSCCNIGIEKSHGKYVRFLDSDDWLETDTLDYLLKKLADSNADVIFTKSVKEIVYKNTIQEYGVDFTSTEDLIKLENLDIPFSEKRPYFFSLSDCEYKRQLIVDSEIKFTEGASFDDTVLYLTPFLKTKTIQFIDKVLYHYLIGRPEQSISNYNASKHYQLVTEYIKCLDVCKDLESKTSALNLIYILKFASWVIDRSYSSIFNCDASVQKKLYDKLDATIRQSSILSNANSKKRNIFKHLSFFWAKSLVILHNNICVKK